MRYGADGSGEVLKSVGVAGLAFPNGEDSPAGHLQRFLVALVAGAVRRDFRSPVGDVGFHLAAAVDAVRAAVPETAMDKDAGPAGGEDEVRPSGQSARVEAVTEAGRVKIPANREFGCGIFAADSRHDFASPGGRYRVHGGSKSGV